MAVLVAITQALLAQQFLVEAQTQPDRPDFLKPETVSDPFHVMMASHRDNVSISSVA